MSFRTTEGSAWNVFLASPPSGTRFPPPGPSLGSEEQDAGEEGEGNYSRPTKFCARDHWRSHEDARLRELVSEQGPQSWNRIAEKIPGRSGKSCRLRWFNQLDPRINRKAFTEEEEARLVAAHRTYGNKWSIIARLFPGRTDNAVKNHWHVILARRRRRGHQIAGACRPTQPRNYIAMSSNIVGDSLNDDHSAASTLTCLSPSTMTTSSSSSNPNPGSSPNGGKGSRPAGTDSALNDVDQEQNAKKVKTEMPFYDFLGVGGGD
ncbi:hypothetical protein DM860_005880 [Cuscuta australis]|uniref:Uncharacterized protein n=1 Tax=Cuscuta australis TaxID=267555 RepID=A0A328DSX1_9ASTE|nr:hypothetical protein DM860_005880 [Cuscuta australis]